MTPFKKSKWKPIAGLLNELRRTEKWGHHLSRHPVFRIWEDVVGKRISSVARPVSVKSGRLIIEVAESAWMQELQLLADDLLEKLNSSLENGNLNQIQFRLGNAVARDNEFGFPNGPLAAERVFREKRRPVALSTEDEKAAKEALGSFQDEELRDRVERLLSRVNTSHLEAEEGEACGMNREERG